MAILKLHKKPTKIEAILTQFEHEQVKLGFTRACRSIEGLGIKWLKTR